MAFRAMCVPLGMAWSVLLVLRAAAAGRAALAARSSHTPAPTSKLVFMPLCATVPQSAGSRKRKLRVQHAQLTSESPECHKKC